MAEGNQRNTYIRSQLLLRRSMLFRHKSFSFAKSHLTTVRTWKARQRAVLNYTVNLRKVAVCVFNNAMLKGVYLIALAGTDGLEPSLRESKSRALPLRYVPIKALRSANRTYLTRKILRVGYLLPEVLLDTQTHKGNFHSSREIRYRIGFS